MTRAKLSEEELKMHKKERNQKYYQKVKGDVAVQYKLKYKEAIQYIVSISNVSNETITEHIGKLNERYHSLVLGALPPPAFVA